MNVLCSIIYCMVGFGLAYYWFNKEYEAEYNELVKTGGVEDGMASLLLLYMIVLWPFKLVYNLIKYKRV